MSHTGARRRPIPRDRALVQLRMRKDLYKQLQAMAREKDLPVAAVIRAACVQALNQPVTAAE